MNWRDGICSLETKFIAIWAAELRRKGDSSLSQDSNDMVAVLGEYKATRAPYASSVVCARYTVRRICTKSNKFSPPQLSCFTLLFRKCAPRFGRGVEGRVMYTLQAAMYSTVLGIATVTAAASSERRCNCQMQNALHRHTAVSVDAAGSGR